MPETPPPSPPPFAPIVRRATLYGAALGLMAGLIDRAVLGSSASEVVAIERWRNFILVGAAVGLLLGVAFAWFVRRVFARSQESFVRSQESGVRSQQEETAPTDP